MLPQVADGHRVQAVPKANRRLAVVDHHTVGESSPVIFYSLCRPQKSAGLTVGPAFITLVPPGIAAASIASGRLGTLLSGRSDRPRSGFGVLKPRQLDKIINLKGI